MENIFGFTFSSYTIIREKGKKYGNEAVSLYIRYIQQAYIQESINTHSNNFFMAQAMGRERKKFLKVKKILIKNKFIFQKKWGYIEVPYIIGTEKIKKIKCPKNGPSVFGTVPKTDRPKNGPQNKYIEVNKNKNKIIIKNKYIYSSFQFFWQKYPKKIWKQKSFQIYKNIKEEEHTALLRGLEKIKKNWEKIDNIYIPHPSTWLSQERRKDEEDEEEKKEKKDYKKWII